jgi:predicted enzyme related to lactoylglutathione lyase
MADIEKIYTCYNCSFPFKATAETLPAICPSCSAPAEQYLSEPNNGMDNRRIHVDPPEPDPAWDPMNSAYHHPKFFPAGTRNGRIRRFVLPYDDAAEIRAFYEEAFGWDIIDTENADPEAPLMFAATGPGSPNWEPSVSSFGFGYLRKREPVEEVGDPRFAIEVDSIADSVAKVIEFGGRLIRDTYVEDGKQFAIIEDSEGNSFYLWQTPDTVTWDELESQTMTETRKFKQVVRAQDVLCK